VFTLLLPFDNHELGNTVNVWVVDDDASIRWCSSGTQTGRMETKSFEHADAALGALRQGAPDVLVTDIRMPGRSGLEMLQEIRTKRPRLRSSS